MKNVKERFELEDMELVIRLYEEGYSTREIATITKLTFQEVVVLLKRLVKDFNVDNYVDYDKIDDSRLLIVADTHIGSRFENIDYIREAYKYAEDHGIHIAIHCGDVIQSTVANVKRDYISEEAQVKHVIEDYPYSVTMKTYVLLGNHDYLSFKKDAKYLELLKTRDDFNIMGYRRIYLKWLGSRISIYHSVKKFLFHMPVLPTSLSLCGHSHMLSYNGKEDELSVPALCNDMIQNKGARPGFLIGTKNDESIDLNSFYFTDSLRDEGVVLTKKLK